MLDFARPRIPTPSGALPLLHRGSPLNLTVLLTHRVTGPQLSFRASDRLGTNFLLSPFDAPTQPLAGDVLHLSSASLIGHHDDVWLVQISASTVVRISRRERDNLAIELCGGTGSMLDAAELVGFQPHSMVEINPLIGSLSTPRHKIICGDASHLSLYRNHPDIHLLLMGFPCQPFSHNGTGKGESDPRGILASLGPIVAHFLDCRCLILETVPGFAAATGSHNSLSNLTLISQACGFHLSTCDTRLERVWIQHRHRLIIVGSRSPLPPSFEQSPCLSPSLQDIPAISWDADPSSIPLDCWPDHIALAMIHDPSRSPFNYSRVLSRRSLRTHTIMRGYATFCPPARQVYLSQVVEVSPLQVESAPSGLRSYLVAQIQDFGFPVRFLTPSEALLIAGILPQSGPTPLLWELAGNACSPFLLFDALIRISPRGVSPFLSPADLQRAWMRRLGHPLPLPPTGDFPPPYNTTIFVHFGGFYRILRSPESASVTALSRAASLLVDVDPDVHLLAHLDSSLPAASLTAGDLFGCHLVLIHALDI